MGADLYINKISDALHDEYLPQFDKAVAARDAAIDKDEKERLQEDVDKYYDLMYEEGYFRDSYNATSILNRLGLSWWGDVVPMLNEEKLLSVEQTKVFLSMVESKTLVPATAEELRAKYAQVDEEGVNSVDCWNAYFSEKYQKLIAFLKQAIELNEPIYCSL